MSRKAAINRAAAALVTTVLVAGTAGSALAGSKIEKVDIVREGIDVVPIVVAANPSGYTGHKTVSHKYYMRLFAKSKGSANTIVMMEMFAGSKETGFGKLFGRHTAKTGTKGWKVYKKSVTINAPVSETHWQKTPKQVCNENLAHKMQQGMSKSDVLAQEWKLQTIAVFSARATADREATIKNGNPIHDSETKSKALAYAVNVLCERVVEPRSAFRDYDTFRRQPDRFVRPGRGAAEHGAFVRPAQGGFFGQGRPFRPFFGNVRPAYRFGVRR